MSYVHFRVSAVPRKLGVPVLCVSALFVAWIWYAGSLDREISDMPAPQRQALYQRTSQTLQQSCATETDSALRDYCRDQADFILHFPECDEDCHALARRFLHVPAR